MALRGRGTAFASASGVFGRSYITPPGVPAARLAILRRAFDETTRDPAFRADAKRLRVELAEEMTRSEISRAQKLAREWLTRH